MEDTIKYLLDMIPLILVMGCVFFLCIGAGIAACGVEDIGCQGLDIKNIIMLLFGTGIIIFACFCIIKASKYYYKEEGPKTEITTSVPAQIDTIITIRNSVSDTSYIYKFNLTGE